MATVQFSEPVDEKGARNAAEASASEGDSTGIGGVYSLRNISHASLEKRFSRGSGRDKFGIVEDPGEEDEDAGLRNAGDYKKRQVFKGKMLAWLAYQSIGVIYGDIGTSPLYVYSSTFTKDPSYADLTGVLSIIIWTLTLMVTVKYVLVILHCDNAGEGGTFSTYSLLSRYAVITNRDPREASLIKMERHKTGDMSRGNAGVRSLMEQSRFARGVLKVMGVLAVSMVMSDGILTPAQSVLGAVQGISVVNPDISKSVVIGTTCAILILLYLIQPLGTTKLASTFAPIVIIWLGFNAAFGIYNLIVFDHSVLNAFNPALGFEYLIRNGTDGWRSLGGVLLSFTGVEALFADLGAFNRQAIQLSWLCYAFPCILLAYIGQAAYISIHPSAWTNPFFNSVPPGTLYPALVIAILAAIVASQAIITATFQLISQIMKLSYFPQIKVVHTSKIFHGQLYVPMLNWLMMVGTVLIAAVYNNTTSLGNAYGVCVMFVTFFDTCMVSLAALVVWRIKPYYVFFPWLTIACLDGAFISSALIKVPDGAWFTIALAIILAGLFILWRYGKENQWAAEAEDRYPTTHFVRGCGEGRIELVEKYGGNQLSSIRGLGIFFDKAGETTPIVFSQFVTKLVATPEFMVFLHLRPLERPSVDAAERYTVSRLAIPNCYRLVIRHGYMDAVISPNLASLVVDKVRDYIIRTKSMKQKRKISPDDQAELDQADRRGEASTTAHDKAPASASDDSDDDTISVSLAKLEDAFNHQVLYIIGKEQMRVKRTSNWGRTLLLRTFLWIRENTRTKIASLKVPIDKVVEVGFVKDV